MADYDYQALRAMARVAGKQEAGEIPLPEGTNHIGEIGGSTATLLATVPTSAPAYANGDVVGGPIEFAGSLRVDAGTGVLGGVLLVDTSNQKAPLTLFFYNREPTGVYPDNGAPAGSAADAPYLLGVVQVLAADYLEIGGVAYCEVGGLGTVLQAEADTSLWVVVVSNGTPTYAANSLRVRLGVFRD